MGIRQFTFMCFGGETLEQGLNGGVRFFLLGYFQILIYHFFKSTYTVI